MAATARKYNPGFLTDHELVESFCVRTAEFASAIEMLRECDGTANPHRIVIGRRGSGKTSLLLRVAAEIRRDDDLLQRFYPVVFAEESYEVSTAGEFWLECLSRLAEQAPTEEGAFSFRRTVEDLRTILDDRTLGDRCLGALLDFADREGKRLVLIVENLNMMFGEMADDDAGWRLRQTLQTEPRVLLLASATSRFDEIDNPDRALYDLFRVVPLQPLDKDECAVLWERVSGRYRDPEDIRALEILTGGSPRLIAIVARFGAELSFCELMQELLDLVDDHTEYFKSHLDALPAQERRVYLALADLWKPATTREVADRARLDTSKCSAQLNRLIERGAVEVTGGSARRKQYYLAERLYNIYYLMRRARGPVPLIEALIRFMEGYYSTDELREFSARIADEAKGVDGVALLPYRTAFERLVELGSLAAHREELLALAPWMTGQRPGGCYMRTRHARTLVNRAFALASDGYVPEALAAWEEVVRQLGASSVKEDTETVATALINRGTALGALGRPEDALASWDEVLRRYRSGGAQAPTNAAARALVNKAAMFGTLGRQEEGLAACNELLERFGAVDVPAVLVTVAAGIVCKGVLLSDLNRPEEALEAWDEVVQRFGTSDDVAILEEVAGAQVNQGAELARQDRLEEALEAWMNVAERFGNYSAPKIVRSVAMALANAGSAMLQLDRHQESLAVWDQLIGTSRTAKSPDMLAIAARAFNQKGATLVKLNRQEEALTVWDELVRHPGMTEAPELLTEVSRAFGHKGALLAALERPEEALAAYEEVVRRFGAIEVPEILAVVAEALVNKGGLLVELNHPQEGFAVWDEAVRRFGSSDVSLVRDGAALALLYKGAGHAQVGQFDEAITAWDGLIQRFGSDESPLARETVAMALANKGGALAETHRPEEALVALDEVVRRHEADDAPVLVDVVATALLGKGTALIALDRLAEAALAYDKVLEHSGERTTPQALEAVASALLNKGSVLAALERPNEARASWEAVVQRFESSDLPMLRDVAEMALFRQADAELTSGRAVTAIALVERALRRAGSGAAEIRWRGHAIRARAHLLEGEGNASVEEIKVLLAMLPALQPLPREVLDELSWLAVEMDAHQLRDLIRESSAADVLLPMTTALEQELGMQPRVAREVEEVAKDIRRDWEARRSGGKG